MAELTNPLERSVPAIQASQLTKSYGKQLALNRLDLVVPSGLVFGYLGPNGAGKTTTIRLLVGQLRPTDGTATVLGMDVGEHRDQVQGRIGYLPGDFAAYPDLTGHQYLSYLAQLRGGLDRTRITELSDRLGLDLRVKVGSLSHGNRQKVGLIQAFMHHPELLILDEPSSGLDPLVQREFLALVREARAEGRTVFLSSHILAEVEAVADAVAIIREGKLMIVESVENLKGRARRRLELTFQGPVPVEALRSAPGVKEVRSEDSTALLVVEGSTADLLTAAAPFGVSNIRTLEEDLEQIFLSFYGGEG